MVGICSSKSLGDSPSVVYPSASSLALCLAALLAAGDGGELKISRSSLVPVTLVGWSGECAEGLLLRP